MTHRSGRLDCRATDAIVSGMKPASFLTGVTAWLEENGISTAIHYPRPIHLQPALASAGGRKGDLPVSEDLSQKVLSLPLYPELTSEQVDRVSAEVARFCRENVAVMTPLASG